MEYDDNMLTYVILHELAHVETRELGHGSEFIEKFEELLERAEKFGIWIRDKPRVENYCSPPR
jgi:predicted metal-dependent hydrolase